MWQLGVTHAVPLSMCSERCFWWRLRPSRGLVEMKVTESAAKRTLRIVFAPISRRMRHTQHGHSHSSKKARRHGLAALNAHLLPLSPGRQRKGARETFMRDTYEGDDLSA